MHQQEAKYSTMLLKQELGMAQLGQSSSLSSLACLSSSATSRTSPSLLAWYCDHSYMSMLDVTAGVTAESIFPLSTYKSSSFKI